MGAEKRYKFRGSMLLLLTAVIWGTSFIATKSGAETIGPFAFNSIRSFIGGIALIPVIALSVGKKQKHISGKGGHKDLLKGGVLCGLALFLAGAFQQIGILYTSAGKTGFITSLYVVMVPVLQIFFRKKVKAGLLVCVIAALAGFCMLSMNGSGSIQKGDVLIFIGAFWFAVHILIINHYASIVDNVKMSCIQFFSCGTIAAVGMLGIDPFLGFAPLNIMNLNSSAAALLYSGIMACSVAYTLQIVGQRMTDSVVASLILSLESVFAVISGALIFGERMVVREIIGCVLIFAAVVAAQFFSHEKKDSGNPGVQNE